MRRDEGSDSLPQPGAGPSRPGRPPRLAAWLLSRILPPEERDNVLGDLEEAFSQGPTSSPALDRFWFWSRPF